MENNPESVSGALWWSQFWTTHKIDSEHHRTWLGWLYQHGVSNVPRASYETLQTQYTAFLAAGGAAFPG
jgi:hypothetical protein